MHITSVTLRNVGRFRAPVTVKGIGPGLNVLAAPNEAGKSTLFRAVDLLFREKHTTTRRTPTDRLKPNAPVSLAAVEPLTGGAPEISATFEVDGVAWRLTKRFLQQKMALLERADGAVRYEGDDVQPALMRLISANGEAAPFIPLLWVGQREALQWHTPHEPVQRAFANMAEQAAADATGNSRLDEVLRDTSADLDRFLTSTRKQPKKDGPLDRARAAWEAACDVLARCEAQADDARARIAEYDALTKRLHELRDGDAVARERAECARLTAECDQAAAAEAAFQAADARMRSEQKLFEAATARVKGLQDLAERVRERDHLADDGVLMRQLSTAEDACATAREACEVAATARAAAEAVQAAMHVHDRHDQLMRVRAGLEARRATIAEIDARLAAIDAEEVGATVVTPDVVAELVSLSHEARGLAERCGEQAVEIDVDYDDGAAAEIVIDDRALAHGERRQIDRETVLVVPGVGRVTVRPGRDGRELREQADRAAQALSDALSACGAGDLDHARQLERMHSERVQERALLTARRTQAAPDGLPSIAQELADIDRALGELAALKAEGAEVPDGLDGPGAQAAVAETRAEHEAAQRALHVAEADVEAARRALRERDAMRSRLDEAIGRLVHTHMPDAATGLAGALNGCADNAERDAEHDPGDRHRLPAPERCDAWIADADAEREQAHSALRAAAAERDAQRALRLEPEALASLNAAREAAEAAVADRARAIREAHGRRDVLEALLRDRGQAGIGEQLADARAQTAAAEAEWQALRRRVAGLVMLERELRDEIVTARSSRVRPVVTRMQSLAKTLFVDADVAVGDALGAPALVRDNVELPADHLSGGVQEQLAILARLAYADILARNGMPLPVVLDDVLVFADDARLARVFDMLRAAGERHQVVLLTCHANAHAPLLSDAAVRALSLQAVSGVRDAECEAQVA